MFWTAAAFAGVLKAYVRTRGEPGFGSLVSLSDWQCRRTVLRTADGGRHLLLRDHTHVLQVLCRGAELTTDPFALELVVDQFPDVEGRLALLKALADLYRQRRIGGGTGGWTVEALRHRDALAALDLRAAGRSYREIAVFLHGEARVEADWANPDQILKNRIATGRPARAYSEAQHAAWLAARRIGR